jgi:hypothetical protein
MTMELGIRRIVSEEIDTPTFARKGRLLRNNPPIRRNMPCQFPANHPLVSWVDFTELELINQ